MISHQNCLPGQHKALSPALVRQAGRLQCHLGCATVFETHHNFMQKSHNFMQKSHHFMQRDHMFQQRARCNLWDRLVLRARDLCLAMRLPGRSASRLVWPTLSATSNRTPSKASTAFTHAGKILVMLQFAS